MKFHHIGVACADISEMKKYLHKLYDVACESESVTDDLQEAVLCMVTLEDGTKLELVSGKKVETLVRKRQFLYHICYTVNNIYEKVEEFMQLGAIVISDPTPAKLFHGNKVAFLMTPLGMIELLETEENWI